MARNVLFLLGIGSIGWAMLSLFFAGAVLPDWMGLANPSKGPLYIESMAVNVGLWSALGAFAVVGATFQRLRLAAVLTFVVCGAGFAGGRILAMVQGAKPDIYTVIALALEVGMVVAASVAYISEKTRIAREAKELKKAEKAALEAALAAEHAATPAEAPAPTPVQQP
jgi:multidrug efflux pump subunit AcrB